MKILMPVLHYWPVIGGLESWTKNIAERQSLKGEVFIVTGKVLNEKVFETKNNVKIFRNSLYSLKDLSYSSPFYIITTLPFIFLKSLNIIKQEKINVLHCQGFLSGLLGYFLLKSTGTPYIITVQRMEKSKGFCRKLVYRNAQICIAASLAIGKYFKDIGCKNIEVIPNGINLEKFGNLNREENRKKLGLKDEFVIMTVARLEKVKGMEYLIGAVKDFKLLIIGDGSERKNLENLVKNLHLEDKVKFLGQISNEMMPEMLVVADCFVLPSVKEGFGIVILEAMAVGVPVIGTRVGGILDIIEDGKNGILVEPEDSKGISNAVLKIYSHPELAKLLIENARSGLNNYDWNDIAEKVNKIYLKFSPRL